MTWLMTMLLRYISSKLDIISLIVMWMLVPNTKVFVMWILVLNTKVFGEKFSR